MKRSKKRLCLAALALALAGCAGPTSSTILSPGSAGAENAPGTGGISVNFPSPSARSGLIDVTKASTYSNYYELIAYNASNSYFINTNTAAKATSTGGTIANMAPGTYTLVALAGLATGDSTAANQTGMTFLGSAASAPNVVLLGSASATGVVVTAGANTNQPLTLTNVLFTISATQTVAVNSTYSVTMTGDTGSPMLAPQNLGYLAYWSPAPTNFGTPYTSFQQAWSVTANFQAPATSGSQTVEIISWGLPLSIIDANTAGYAQANGKFVVGVTGTYWNLCPTDGLPGYVSGGYDMKIAAGSALVNFSTGGIGSTISWGNGR